MACRHRDLELCVSDLKILRSAEELVLSAQVKYKCLETTLTRTKTLSSKAYESLTMEALCYGVDKLHEMTGPQLSALSEKINSKIIELTDLQTVWQKEDDAFHEAEAAEKKDEDKN